jgi:hypothetical protein
MIDDYDKQQCLNCFRQQRSFWWRYNQIHLWKSPLIFTRWNLNVIQSTFKWEQLVWIFSLRRIPRTHETCLFHSGEISGTVSLFPSHHVSHDCFRSNALTQSGKSVSSLSSSLLDGHFTFWDFKFSRRRVWCSELSSGLYCRVKWLSFDICTFS